MNLKNFSVVLVILLFFVCSTEAQLRPLPVFTKNDYKNLLKSGHDLKFSERSLWLPKTIRDNLMKILKHTLTDQYSTETIKRISFDDFFHGHVECQDPHNEQILMQDFQRIEKEEFETICDTPILLKNVNNPKCMPFLKQALIRTEIRFGQRLRKILENRECQNLSILYHTREFNRTKMPDTDPARNIRVSLPDLNITHFKEKPPFDFNDPKADIISFIQSDHPAMIAHFGFFIDKSGIIHVTIGSNIQLSLGYDFPQYSPL